MLQITIKAERRVEHGGNQRRAYDDKNHENDFADFYVNLIALLFDEECEKYKENVAINQEVLEEALTINEIGVNTLY